MRLSVFVAVGVLGLVSGGSVAGSSSRGLFGNAASNAIRMPTTSSKAMTEPTPAANAPNAPATPPTPPSTNPASGNSTETPRYYSPPYSGPTPPPFARPSTRQVTQMTKMLENIRTAIDVFLEVVKATPELGKGAALKGGFDDMRPILQVAWQSKGNMTQQAEDALKKMADDVDQ